VAADGAVRRRLRRTASVLVAAVALAGCGAEAERAATALDATWRLPNPEWQTGGSVSPGARGLRLEADGKGDTRVVVAPRRVPAGMASRSSATAVLPGSWGAAGVTCRSDAELSTGYAFVVSRAGGWWLFRYDDGASAEITNGGIDPRDLAGEEPVQLHLSCRSGEDDGTTVLRFAYADRRPITTTDRGEATGTRSGFLVTEQLDLDRETVGILERFDLRAR